MSMNLPAQSPETIFAQMRDVALRSFDGKDVLRRSVTKYVIECGRRALGPNQESKTLEKKYEDLKLELEKAETLLSEKTTDVERGRKVADLRREMGQVNRDKQNAYRIARTWCETGEQLEELLRKELGE